MTRQGQRDRDVISSAQGLDFIVLDELHTYRGRQGADVAMLVRRVRDQLCRETSPICIGTSATMSSEESDGDRAEAVAAVATKLFGAQIEADAVIDESLRRATDPALRLDTISSALSSAMDADLPALLDDDALRQHPLAVWIELRLGLRDEQKLTRQPPTSIGEAARRLSEESGRPKSICRDKIQSMLTLMNRPANERGGSGESSFLAFKLHRFISGAGNAFSTLRAPGSRRVSLDGQRYEPEDPGARLYATFFCRSCGQEFHPVTMMRGTGISEFVPRSIDDTPLEDSDTDEVAGYLMPEPENDPEYSFGGEPGDYPEEWQELTAAGLRLRTDKRKFAPQALFVEPNGVSGAGGRKCWFMRGKFRFCPACGEIPAGQAREFNKLASLSAEGRSSATTILVSSVLRWMNKSGTDVDAQKRKLLGFTDNRQDAALQAGHFNDFIFVSLLRAATLAALRRAGEEGLGDDDIGARIQEALGFRPSLVSRRIEWMLDPVTTGVGQITASKAIARVLRYRVWADQRRGWRYTN